MTKKEAEIRALKNPDCGDDDYIEETFGPFILPEENQENKMEEFIMEDLEMKYRLLTKEEIDDFKQFIDLFDESEQGQVNKRPVK